MMLALPAVAILLLSAIFAGNRTSGPAATDDMAKIIMVVCERCTCIQRQMGAKDR